MIYEKIPEHWSKRKIIVILDKDDIERLYEEQEELDELVLNDACCIISPPLDETNEIAQELINNKLDEKNKVLVQNPYYHNKYSDLKDFSYNFPLERYFIFSELCKYLGAKKVRIEEIEIKKEGFSKRFNLDVSGTLKTVSAGFYTNVLSEFDSNFFRKLTLNFDFPGGSPDIELARKHLKNSSLIAAYPESALLKMREGENKLEKMEFEFNISEETNNIFQLMAALNLQALSLFSAEIKFAYETAVKRRHETSLKVSVVF